MELEQLIDEIYSGRTTNFEGIIKIKDIDTQVKSSLNLGQKRELLMVNIIAISKTNIAMSCTYVVDVKNDDKNTVAGDFESLVAYMFFGVDKVAKKAEPAVPNEG